MWANQTCLWPDCVLCGDTSLERLVGQRCHLRNWAARGPRVPLSGQQHGRVPDLELASEGERAKVFPGASSESGRQDAGVSVSWGHEESLGETEARPWGQRESELGGRASF